MLDQLKGTMKVAWLISATSALLVPVFVPSYTGGTGFNPIETSMLMLFVLSLPSSFLSLPAVFVIMSMLRMDTRSIDMLYVQLVMMFVAGFVQWFWLVPRLFGNEPPILQKLDLPGAVGNPRLFTRNPESCGDWVDAKGTTPLERVMREDGD
ncbi:MAG TPA: hypothetical protein VNA22_09105 [Pyrinomonadaceae bacterium]|nr:hypothetical protein [Pyrinomonadaceae bacterium]